MTEKSPSYEVDVMPWEEKSDRAALVLGEMDITDKTEFYLVSCKVERFTVEAKVNDGSYGAARGFAELVPKDLWLHVPVYKPGQLVDDGGNVGIFGAVFQYISRELDLQVFGAASRRADLKTAIEDREAEVKTRRFDVGKARKEVAATTESSSVL